MKKILLTITVAIIAISAFSQGSPSTQKSVTDMKDFLVLRDSAVIEDNYAEMWISKDGLKILQTNPKRDDGAKYLYYNQPLFGGNSTASPDIKLDAKEFNNFTNNDTLGMWLSKAISKDYYIDWDVWGTNLCEKRYSIILGNDTILSFKDTITYQMVGTDTIFDKQYTIY